MNDARRYTETLQTVLVLSFLVEFELPCFGPWATWPRSRRAVRRSRCCLFRWMKRPPVLPTRVRESHISRADPSSYSDSRPVWPECGAPDFHA